MPGHNKRKLNNVTPRLLTFDAFAASPLVQTAQGTDITYRYPEPEWSAFYRPTSYSLGATQRSYVSRLREQPSKVERDRLRRRYKRAERRHMIEERQRSREAKAKLRRVFKAARKAETKMVRKIENCLINGNQRRAKALLREYLKSFSAKLVAFEKANNKLKPRFRRTAEQLIEEARDLNPFQVEREPVQLRLMVKDNSPKRIAYKLRWKDHRLVQSFGLRHKARQYLCKRVLELYLLPSLRPDQTGVQGTRHADAIAKIIRTIESGELRYFLELDVENFFPNIGTGDHNRDGDSIYRLEDWLPLPKRIIQTCVLSKHNTVDLSRIPSTSILSQRMDSQRGIPQGSASSPLIASYVMAQLLDALERRICAGTHLVSYVDNVGIYGSKPVQLMIARLALMLECSSSRFGTLRLKDRFRLVNADHGFDFLGYHIKRVVTDGQSKAVVTVSKTGLLKFRREVRRRLKDARITSHVPNAAECREDAIYSMQQFVQGWCAGYSCVPDIQEVAQQEANKASIGLARRHLLREAFRRV